MNETHYLPFVRRVGGRKNTYSGLCKLFLSHSENYDNDRRPGTWTGWGLDRSIKTLPLSQGSGFPSRLFVSLFSLKSFVVVRSVFVRMTTTHDETPHHSFSSPFHNKLLEKEIPTSTTFTPWLLFSIILMKGWMG